MVKKISLLFLCFILFAAPTPITALENASKNEDELLFTYAVDSITAQENAVIQLVNAERAKARLKPLQKSTALSRVARLKSQDMANKNYFSHTSPTYGNPFKMMQAFNIKFSTAGENIALGQTTAQQVMNSWMNSPGHRRNILSPRFTQIGVGLAKNRSGRNYWTQQFITP